MEKLTQLTHEQLVGYVKKQKLRIRQLENENETLVATSTTQSQQVSALSKSLEKLQAAKSAESSSSVSSFFGINLGSIDVLDSLQQLGQSLGSGGADEPFQLVGQSYEDTSASSTAAGDSAIVQRLQREVDDWRAKHQSAEASKKKYEAAVDSLTIEKNNIAASYETAIKDLKKQLELSNQAFSDYKARVSVPESASASVEPSTKPSAAQLALEKKVQSLTIRLKEQESVVSDFRELSAKHAGLTHELAAAKSELELNAQTTQSLRAQLAKAQSADTSLSQSQAELDALRLKLASLSQELAAESVRSTAATEELAAHKALVDEHYVKRADAILQSTAAEDKWRAQLAQLQSERESLHQARADLQAQLDEQRSRSELSARSADQELSGLRSVVGHLKQEISQLQGQLADARAMQAKSATANAGSIVNPASAPPSQLASAEATSKLDEEIAKLKAEVSAAETKLQGIKSSGVSKNNKNFKAAKSEFDRVTRRLEELETTRVQTVTDETALASVQESSDKPSIETPNTDPSTEPNMDRGSTTATLEDERSVLRLEICSLHERLQEVQQSLSEQLHIKESEISQLKQAANDKAREVGEINTQLAGLRDKLSALEVANTELARSLAEYEKQMLAMKASAAESERARGIEASAEVEALKIDLKAYQDRIRLLESNDKSKLSELASLEETHKVKLAASNKTISELKVQIDTITAEKVAISKRCTELEESLTMLNEQVSSGDSDLDLLRSRVMDVERVNAEYAKENKALQKKTEQLSMQLENTLLSMDMQKDEALQDAEEELKKLRLAMSKLTESNKAMEVIKQEDEEKISALSDKVARLKTIVAKYKTVTQEKESELEMYSQAAARARRFEVLLVVSVPLRVGPGIDPIDPSDDDFEPKPTSPTVSYCLLGIDEAVTQGSATEGFRWEEVGKVKKWLSEGSVLLGSWPEDIRTMHNLEVQTLQKQFEKDRAQTQQDLTTLKSAFEAYKLKTQDSLKRLSEEERAMREDAARKADEEIKSLTQLLLELENKFEQLNEDHSKLQEEHAGCAQTTARLDALQAQLRELQESLTSKERELAALKEQVAVRATMISSGTIIAPDENYRQKDQESSFDQPDLLSPLSATDDGVPRGERNTSTDEGHIDATGSPKWTAGSTYVRPSSVSHHAGKDTLLRQQVKLLIIARFQLHICYASCNYQLHILFNVWPVSTYFCRVTKSYVTGWLLCGRRTLSPV